MPDYAISITLDGAPDLPSAVLQALYRITGRSTVELRDSIRRREPVYTAALFGNDHIDVVPRLEKVAAYLGELGLPFTLHEVVDGERGEITAEVMRSILEAN
ncbi:hypothetical protein [Microbacterium sp.]|uniref:hypothetical protein n=1 Tax=Microbacterium sp. TaxID=51671 RepID=UPI003C789E37